MLSPFKCMYLSPIGGYFVNRMPSFVLASHVPHRVLFPDLPLYHLPHRVFSCTCYVHALDHGRDNLDPWAIKCAFFGYSRTQKGYKFYSPSVRSHFVCIDVTFNENLPYFLSPSSSPEEITHYSVAYSTVFCLVW